MKGQAAISETLEYLKSLSLSFGITLSIGMQAVEDCLIFLVTHESFYTDSQRMHVLPFLFNLLLALL